METTVDSGRSMTRASVAPTARGMLTSVALHVLALTLLMLVPAGAMTRVAPPKQLDVVFHRPRPIEIPIPAPPVAAPKGPERAGRPAAPVVSQNPQPSAPEAPGKPDLPPGPESQPPQQQVGNAGILAFRDKFASLAKNKPGPRLGADARLSNAVDRGENSAPSALTTNSPGSSGGIDPASLRRNLGGGGGGSLPGVGGGGRGGGGPGGGGFGVGVGRATSPIAPGGDRPLARGGPGPARTDEEIQIVFDRYKASFYRLYNRELRKDPTLKGQMVLRLTIEPDGSVSMCRLQSSDMNAPDLADQVVAIVLTINFGSKEDVKALTISYPIDFLPAT